MNHLLLQLMLTALTHPVRAAMTVGCVGLALILGGLLPGRERRP